MAFCQCFFDTPEVTKKFLQKVLQNFRKAPSYTCWPRELNQKGFFFFLFSQNTQYRARQKFPPLVFFGIVRHFSNFFFTKGSPFSFLGILRQDGYLKIPEAPLYQFIRHCETFFRRFFTNGSAFTFLIICDRMDDQSIFWVRSGAPVRSNFYVFRVL